MRNRIWEFLTDNECPELRSMRMARRAVETIVGDGAGIIQTGNCETEGKIDVFLDAWFSGVDIEDPLPELLPFLLKTQTQLDQEIARLTALQKGGAQ